MPIIIRANEIKQQSDEWHKFRAEGIGSSDIGSIMGLNKYRPLRKLWLEKTGLEVDEFKDNEATLYGKHMEPYAVSEYEWEAGVMGFEPALFIHSKYGFARASVDAYHFDLKYALEIKSPYNPKNIEHATRGLIDRKYYAQLQWILFVTETRHIKYCVYSGTRLWVKDVSEDVSYQRRMLRYAKWFWSLVTTKTDPKKRKPRKVEIDATDVTEG